MTLSFSNKRPISIAIDISAVTRYARLMDPRLSLRRTPCFVPSLSRTLIPLFIFHPPRDGRSWPLLDEHKASATPLFLSLSFFTFTCPSLFLPRLANFPLHSIGLSIRFNQGKHSKPRYTYTHIHVWTRWLHRFRIFDSKSRLRDVVWMMFEGTCRSDSLKLFIFDIVGTVDYYGLLRI